MPAQHLLKTLVGDRVLPGNLCPALPHLPPGYLITVAISSYKSTAQTPYLYIFLTQEVTYFEMLSNNNKNQLKLSKKITLQLLGQLQPRQNELKYMWRNELS